MMAGPVRKLLHAESDEDDDDNEGRMAVCHAEAVASCEVSRGGGGKVRE